MSYMTLVPISNTYLRLAHIGIWLSAAHISIWYVAHSSQSSLERCFQQYEPVRRGPLTRAVLPTVRRATHYIDSSAPVPIMNINVPLWYFHPLHTKRFLPVCGIHDSSHFSLSLQYFCFISRQLRDAYCTPNNNQPIIVSTGFDAAAGDKKKEICDTSNQSKIKNKIAKAHALCFKCLNVTHCN